MRWLVFLLVILGWAGLASLPAQNLPVFGTTQPYTYDSGLAQNAGASPALAASHTISFPGASSLRVIFSSLVLGPRDFVRVFGSLGGGAQKITSAAAQDWSLSSAYWNGDTLYLELWLKPGSSGRFVTSAVQVGQQVFGTDSICGPADNRVPINDNRAFRLVSNPNGSGGGCTGFLVGPDSCSLTAGHCAGILAVAEFNVPLSNPNGSVNHPPVSDQFPVNAASLVFHSNGLGDDWAVFKLNPNNLGASAAQLHGWFQLGFFIPNPGSTMRVTGFGSGGGPLGPQFAFTNRTATGPFVGALATRLEYVVDTTGGNSGSPVISEATGVVIGIHTNAGCTGSGGFNSGTSLVNAAFQAAFMGLCAQNGFYLDLSTTGGGTRDLHMQLMNPPPGMVEGFTLFSLNTASAPGGGPLVGIQPDAITFAILMQPGTPANPLHFLAPFLPGSYPDAPLDLPAGSLPFLGGTVMDGAAVALGPALGFLGATSVVRIIL